LCPAGAGVGEESLADLAARSWWAKAVDAPGYKEVTAHRPQFENKQLWPRLTGKEAFLKEQWPEARVLVWANPGQSGRWHPRRIGLDPTDPRNWLENGKPCSRLVLDENTDLVLPASDAEYTVGFRKSPVREVMRHLTVEAGAGFIGGGDGRGRQIYGNVWIKKGGQLHVQGSTSLLGGRHTFYRNDNYGAGCSQYFSFSKDTPEASVEFLGYAATSDEWKLYRGTVIIGPHSIMQPGRAAEPFIKPEGTLVLLDGAFWGKWCNEWMSSMDLVCEGTIRAGLPRRPLAEDCYVRFACRNWADLDFSKWPRDRLKRRNVSAVFKPGTKIVVTSAEGSNARLVFTAYDFEHPDDRNNGYVHGVGTFHGDSEKRLGLFKDEEFRALFTSKPLRTVVFFDKDVEIDGPVMFDRFAEVLYQEEATRKSWADVQFGPNNVAPPDKLLRQHERPDKHGGY
jgi:hypothetical protein